MAVSNDLRIPEKVYVKFDRRKRDDEELLLGFMTPFDENDSQFKDRKYTVDRWSSHRGKEKSLLDKQAWVGYNEPMKGFEILHTVSRYRTSNKVWRIKDPRGFELEISSWNLSQMLGHVTIEKGVIQNECVWCRNSKGDNWLIPTDCDEYQEAKEYTEVRNTRISLRDVNRGDIVTLHDGRDVKYLGGFYYPIDGSYYTSEEWVSDMQVNRRYYFLVRDEDDEYTKLDSKSSIKVGNLVKATDKPLSKKEAEVVANEAMRVSNIGWRPYPIFLCASKFDPSDIEVVVEDYEVPEDFQSMYSKRGSGYGPVLVADIPDGKIKGGGGFYILQGRSQKGWGEDATYHYKLDKLEKELFLSGLQQKQVRIRTTHQNTSYWGRNQVEHRHTRVEVELPFDESIGDHDWKKVTVKVKGRELDVSWGASGK